ncbi:MAG: hypothetical protein ACJ741_06920 [Pyrinomonadaceae bacterium]
MKQEQTLNGKKLMALAAPILCALACAASVAAQQASTSYKGATRDPFEKRKFIARVVKPGPTLIEPPPVESRIQSYKAKKAAAVAAQLPAPKPTTAFLLNELQVTGIFRTPRGWAAMVEAKPIKLSYVIYPGENFYNGMLVAIEEDRLVVRRETRWSDGKRDTAVEIKPLAAPNAIKDGLTQSAQATGTTGGNSGERIAARGAADETGGQASSSAHGTGPSVAMPGGGEYNLQKFREQFGEIGRKCGEKSTISFKPDGTIVCN